MHSPRSSHAVRTTVRTTVLATLVAIVAFFPSSSRAQLAPGSAPATESRPAKPDPKTSHASAVPSALAKERTTPIVIDGKLDDAAWATATAVSDFTQTDPDDGKPATERTEVRFMFDNGSLYIAAKLFDKLGKKGVTSTLVRRDDYFNSDYFEIVIDGFHDHLSRAFFQVNPTGSKSDFIGTGNSCCDNGWWCAAKLTASL